MDEVPEPTVELRIGQLWRELRRGAGMTALLSHLLGSGGEALESGEWDTLDLLAQQPAWRMGDLARALRVDPSTATRAVQRLIRAGLAERRRCPDDGRVAFVRLSPHGWERHRKVTQRRSQVMEQILIGLDHDDREQIAAQLQRLVDALDQFVMGLPDSVDIDGATDG